MSALWAVPEDLPAPSLLQVALLSFLGGWHQVLALMAAVYPAIAAGAFLAVFLQALRGVV